MMKKLSLSLLTLALLCAPVFAEENDGAGAFPYEKDGQSNENATLEQSHWSIYVPFGVTFADMDETNGAKLGTENDYTLNGGIGVEYNFTPTWGVAAEFNVANYGKGAFSSLKDFGKEGQSPKAYDYSVGVIYNTELFLTFDFMDAFFPKRTSTLFNLYAHLGGGLGFYTFRTSMDKIVHNNISDPNKKFAYAPFLGFGLLADFNLNRNWSLGLRAHYNYYMSDNLDYTVSTGQMGAENGRANSNNDGIFTLDAVVHYKFISREKSHVRNLAVGTLATLEKKAEDAARGEVAQRVPQKDTLVISHKDTLVMATQESSVVKAAPSSEMHFVYFDNNKYKLNDRGHIEVQQMAALLEANPDACLELSGHTDATASDEYNAKLAEKRAAAVRDELINVYGIDESRLVDLGRGKLTNVGTSFGPNRRVDMRVVTRSEVDSIRAAKEAASQKVEAKPVEAAPAEKVAEETKAEQKPVAAKPVAVEETGSTVVEEPFDTTKYLAVEKTGQSTSLSKLARKYYNNTFCWVYIYLENKDVIKTPNYLWPNTKLYIPRLTEEQMAITKAEADAMYGGK